MKKIIPLFFILLPHAVSFSQVWTEQVSNVTVQLTSVSSTDGNSVWICGYSGTVLRTTNSGLNWQNVSGNGIPSTVQLVNIFGIDASSALTAGYISTTTYVYRTSNAGANWTQVFSQSGGGFINAIWMRTNLLGFMEGDPVGARWSLWRTSNGGVTWDSSGMYLPQAGSEAGWNNSLCYLSPRFWFGTSNTRIYYSTNDGVSWVSHSTAPEANSYTILFDYSWGGNSGLLGGATLMLSNDSGVTWTTQTSLGTGNFSGFTGYPLPVDDPLAFQQGKYVRGTNGVYTATSTNNWSLEYTAPAGNYRHLSKARAFGTMTWGVRTNGGITRCTCPIVNITPISNETPGDYLLHQNYPNPFNPVTDIEFAIPERSHVKLLIYNSLGQLTASIFDNDLNTGNYLLSWDAKELPSGIYYYTLLTLRDGTINFIDTKKMIFLK